MQLTDEQRAAVAAWIEAGASLADVQRNLKEQHAVALTYMEVRFLVDDLNLQIKERARPAEASERLAAAKEQGEHERVHGDGAGSGVKVTVDRITKPHALASGKATFTDGESAEWMLDQTGRLALNPSTPGYRPSREDVMAFQDELQRVAQGFA